MESRLRLLPWEKIDFMDKWVQPELRTPIMGIELLYKHPERLTFSGSEHTVSIGKH